MLDEGQVRPRSQYDLRFFNGCLDHAEEMTTKSFREDNLSKRGERLFWKLRALRESRVLYDPTGSCQRVRSKNQQDQQRPLCLRLCDHLLFRRGPRMCWKASEILSWLGDEPLVKYSAPDAILVSGRNHDSTQQYRAEMGQHVCERRLGASLKPRRFKRRFVEGAWLWTQSH